MDLNILTAISPVDGRYRKSTKRLAPYFSEYALIKYRVYVEIKYYLALTELPIALLNKLNKKQKADILQIFETFDEKEALKVKEHEKKVNHDVKAIEYYIKEQFEKYHLSDYDEYVHFGLTSQDINNTAIPLLLKDCLNKELLPKFTETLELLKVLAHTWEDVPMLAHTHGQPASPTRMGKELKVFIERIQNQILQFENIPFSAKFGGATGNFNAHHVAYPDIDWVTFANEFVNIKLQLSRNQYTTQIEHYDNLGALCDVFKRIATIFIDLNRDIWEYISYDYFKQKVNKDEVGSSAMPHKVNPIDFENSEGNLGIAIALFQHLATKLPISRLQRDLTDSTVLRNLGVPFAHFYIAIDSLHKGLTKLTLNPTAINHDLENNWAVVSEAVQTILRREGYPNPYEALKNLTRTGEKITRDTLHKFVDTLNIGQNIKDELKAITPFNYVGIVK